MTPRGATVILTLILTATVGPVLMGQSLQAPLVVGVWDEAGGIIPFTAFDGRRWVSNRRPAGEIESESTPLVAIPAAWVGSSLVSSTWELVGPDGVRSVQVTGLETIGINGCPKNLGFKVDLPARPITVALAANRPGILEPVMAAQDSDDYGRAVSRVLPAVYKRFDAKIRKEKAEALLRNTVDLTVHVYSYKQEQFAYFQAARGRARAGEAPGALKFSQVSGWMWRRNSQVPFRIVTARDTTNDIASFLPWRVVRHGSRQFWIGGWASPEYRALMVLEVGRKRIEQLVRVTYPGC